MWVGSRNCGCLVAWLCYQFMAKPGSRTAAVPSPGPYVFTVYMTHRLSVYILYWHTNAALILVTSYLHIHFSYVHECILTALYCAVFVLLMHVFLWLSLLLLLYIVRNDENKDDQSNQSIPFQWQQIVICPDTGLLFLKPKDVLSPNLVKSCLEWSDYSGIWSNYLEIWQWWRGPCQIRDQCNQFETQ